ncbi:arylamine N-acetyltransferase, pineal gland isozyme NAT-10-like [Electrophorus electricus]|uniref:arylamine N-acetyltransferase n=1 Tax=Electrophorus electricus TaxID=8005 RepID=A0A4W4GSC0_ELEEL|nr:arylamine N-acetyltransferase, pineal gland isozyme NAT-10-like [Electrophorus electricus]
MDLKDYFRRIGFSGRYEKPDLATLSTVHKLHVLSIPFENLSIHCGEKITMDLQVIYDKIVRSHRGGWCCENNFLFSWVLREMGYKYTTLSSKVFDTFNNDFDDMDSHFINMIEIDGKLYIADVGFGTWGQLWHPIEMIAGKDQPQPPGVFRLLNDDERWTLEKTGRKPLILNEAFANCSLANQHLKKTVYSFTLTPRSHDYFLKKAEHLQTSPESLYTKKSICSLQLATGFRALIGWTYIEVKFNSEDDVDLTDIKDIPDSEVEIVLREKFNVTLLNKLTPKNKKI